MKKGEKFSDKQQQEQDNQDFVKKLENKLLENIGIENDEKLPIIKPVRTDIDKKINIKAELKKINKRFIEVFEIIVDKQKIVNKSTFCLSIGLYSSHHLQNIIDGKNNISTRNLFLLKMRYNVNINYIMTGEGRCYDDYKNIIEDFNSIITDSIRLKSKFAELEEEKQILTDLAKYQREQIKYLKRELENLKK